ncbi:rhomboid family intramembrane serine protease [Phreatobacter sp. AB_2022a]|uniref:rhomboid family intramembrane serine protease n=1 Tax=Phreatobacter sp. AB_2022a TaxID=3003134 RepID=UPI0022874879|nr:rhomboid family intramembrane serine protease [Phreatobacter sp. AB_2022a]MCZ0738573.1 rhomboid family intramembrane serine protease [Phreatobacter sp. AB_2022a]
MFLPLADQNPHRSIVWPFVTYALIGLNVVVFLATTGLVPARTANANALGLGLIPAVVTFQATLSPDLALVSPWATWITYMFMHAGWMHLIGNMLFLWVFADNVEDAMGHVRFLIFYLLCGLIAGTLHLLINPGSQAPLVGASGAISGVLAAYLILFPRVRVFGLAFNVLPISIPVWLALGAWIVLQLFHLLTAEGGDTAWWAHIGGLVAGAALVSLFKSRDVMLFCDKQHLPVSVPRIPLRRPPFR